MSGSDANKNDIYLFNLDWELARKLPQPQDNSGYEKIYNAADKRDKRSSGTQLRAIFNEILRDKETRDGTLTYFDKEFQKIGKLYGTDKDPINNFALLLTALKTHDQFKEFLESVDGNPERNSGTVDRILRSRTAKESVPDVTPVLYKCCVQIVPFTRTRNETNTTKTPGTVSSLPILKHINPKISTSKITVPHNTSIDCAIKLLYTKVVDELHKLHKSQSSLHTKDVKADDTNPIKITNFYAFGTTQLQADHVCAIFNDLENQVGQLDELCESLKAVLDCKQQHYYKDAKEEKNALKELAIRYATEYNKNAYEDVTDTNDDYCQEMDQNKKEIDEKEEDFKTMLSERCQELQLLNDRQDEQNSNSSSHNNEDDDKDSSSQDKDSSPFKFITFGAVEPETFIEQRIALYEGFMKQTWKLGVRDHNAIPICTSYTNALACNRTNEMSYVVPKFRHGPYREGSQCLQIGSILPIRERELLILLYKFDISFKIDQLHRNGLTLRINKEEQEDTVISFAIRQVTNRFLSDMALEFINGSMYNPTNQVHKDILGTLSEVLIPRQGDSIGVRRDALPVYEFYTIPSRHDWVQIKCANPGCNYGYSNAEKKRNCMNAGWKDFVEHLNFDLSCQTCRSFIDKKREHKKREHAKIKPSNCQNPRQKRKQCDDCKPLTKEYDSNNASCLVDHGIVKQFLDPLKHCITKNKWKGTRKKIESRKTTTSKRQIVLLTFPRTDTKCTNLNHQPNIFQPIVRMTTLLIEIFIAQ